MQGHAPQTAHANFRNQSAGLKSTGNLDACIDDGSAASVLLHTQAQRFGIGKQIGHQRSGQCIHARPGAGIEFILVHFAFPNSIKN